MYAADLLVRVPVAPAWTKTRIFRILVEFPGTVIDVTPEVLFVTPAKNESAPVAPPDGINDIMFEVKSVPLPSLTNDIPDGNVSRISSTITSVLLLFVSLISKVIESPGEYFVEAHVFVTEMLFAVTGTMIFLPVASTVSLRIPLMLPALPPCSPQTKGAIRMVSLIPTIRQL